MIDCACGQVSLEARGAPMTCAICYCDDCQEAGRQIEALPGAAPVLDAEGGTGYVMFRKDRVRCVKGHSLLRPHKLRATSATVRHVATCCNSAMLLNFEDGKHWADIYRSRYEPDVPPVQMRVCTRFRPQGPALPADVPAYARYPVPLIAKLLRARVAMFFRR